MPNIYAYNASQMYLNFKELQGKVFSFMMAMPSQFVLNFIAIEKII